MSNNNGWGDWKIHILAEIERLASEMHELNKLLREHVDDENTKYTELKVKMQSNATKISLFASAAAFIVATAVSLAVKFL